jgi:hypothetical protein
MKNADCFYSERKESLRDFNNNDVVWLCMRKDGRTVDEAQALCCVLYSVLYVCVMSFLSPSSLGSHRARKLEV